MRTPIIGFLVIAALAIPTSSALGDFSIAVYSDAGGTDCYLSNDSYTTWYILAYPSSSSEGMRGAEFRIEGLPSGYSTFSTRGPNANLDLGDPFGDGCNVAFPTCQTGGGPIVLYTVDVQPPPPEQQEIFHLTAVSRNPPSNPGVDCPHVNLCDEAATQECVRSPRTGQPAVQVPSNPTPAEGATTVSPSIDRLEWDLVGPEFCCGIGTPLVTIWLGTDPDPPVVWSNTVSNVSCNNPDQCYKPDPLDPNTTYYWRVRWTHCGDCGFETGPTWQFTTGAPIAVETTTWNAVKGAYR